MGEHTGISWTGSTWTPIRARVKSDAPEIARAKGYNSLVQIAEAMIGHVGPHCEHASPGCLHCYSETNNSRCLPNNGTGLPFDRRSRDLVDIFLDQNILTQPFHWRTPRKVFVCSQTDLFGDWVPFEMIDSVFAVMALTPHNTYQLLTKQIARALEYLTTLRSEGPSRGYVQTMVGRPARAFPSHFASLPLNSDTVTPWPLPNVWLGVSAENQEQADKRVPLLLRAPAVTRFVSAEPLLGPIDFDGEGLDDLHALGCGGSCDCAPKLDQIIVGGESGAERRPFEQQWAESIRDQCRESGTAFFMKQMSAITPKKAAALIPAELLIQEFPEARA